MLTDFFVSNSSPYAYSNFLNDKASLSGKNRREMCLLAQSFKNLWSILFIDTIQAVLSLLTLVFLWMVWQSVEMRRLYSIVGVDLKLIICSGAIVYVIGSLNSFVVFSYKLIILLMDLSPCYYIWDGTYCYWAQKIYASLCVRAYLILHFGLLLERTIVALLGNKKFLKGIVGFSISLAMLIIAPAYQTYYSNPKVFAQERVYCSALYTSTDPGYIVSSSVLIGLNVAITIGDFFLYLFNRYQMHRYKDFRARQRSGFNLEKSFMLREMELTINVIYPWGLCQSITFCLQMVVFLFYSFEIENLSIIGGNLFYEYVNFGRILGNFILITFLWIHNEYRNTRNTRKVLAQQFRDQQNEHFRMFQRIIS